jgi:hypothetical protein
MYSIRRLNHAIVSFSLAYMSHLFGRQVSRHNHIRAMTNQVEFRILIEVGETAGTQRSIDS